MKFLGNVGNGMRKNWLNFGGDLDSSLDPGIFKGDFSIARYIGLFSTYMYI